MALGIEVWYVKIQTRRGLTRLEGDLGRGNRKKLLRKEKRRGKEERRAEQSTEGSVKRGRKLYQMT